MPGSTDSTSETDSQPATSLLEVSHRSGGGGQPGSLSRRRSGSRTSLGSRVKSLRLTDEQKCGVASRCAEKQNVIITQILKLPAMSQLNREVERIEQDLSEFRVNSRRENRNGVAQIDEKAAL